MHTQQSYAFKAEAISLLKSKFPRPRYENWRINRYHYRDGVSSKGRLMAAQVLPNGHDEWLDICEARADQPERLLELLRSIDPKKLDLTYGDAYFNPCLTLVTCQKCGTPKCLAEKLPIDPETLSPARVDSASRVVLGFKFFCRPCERTRIQISESHGPDLVGRYFFPND